LHLEIGEIVQLQLMAPGVTERYPVKVIGCLPGHSIIVTTPEHKGKVILVREGQRFAVRMLTGSSVYGFVSSVLRSTTQPYPYLHLSYPTAIESTVVRNAPREPIQIEALVRNTKEPRDDAHRFPAQLVDLSSTGACLAVSSPVAEVGDMLELQMRLKVYQVEEDLAIAADVRNLSGPKRGKGDDNELSYRYGVEFRTLNAYQKLLIYSFVLEQTLNRDMME
jgi:c-di-GMP-binding flagellar brake protein YcgR